jgi:hypothetical protein
MTTRMQSVSGLGDRAYLRVCLMMIGMTIDVVENSARALRTAALGALVFDVLYVVHRLLQGLGPEDATPAGIHRRLRILDPA